MSIETEAATLAEKSGTIIFAPDHRDRLDGGTVLLFSSSTDLDAYAPYADASTCLASLQSSSEWHDASQKPLAPIRDDLTLAETVIIAFSDVGTPNGFAEAKSLAGYLRPLVDSVKFLREDRASFAELIDEVPESRRARFVARQVSTPGGTPGARPKAPSLTEVRKYTPDVDVEGARIVTPSPSPEIAETVWLNAAVERVGEAHVWDDFRDPGRRHPEILHDVMVHIERPDGLIGSYPVSDLTDADLLNPRAFLNPVPGGSAISPNPSAMKATENIAAAIRAHRPESVQRRTFLARTGWYRDEDGHWGYVAPNGRLTAAGLGTDIRSKVASIHEAFQLTDPADMTHSDELDAAITAMTTLSELGTHEAVIGLMGPAAYAMGGLSGHRRGQGCVPVYVGTHGSGKSTVIRGFRRAFFTPESKSPTVRAHDTPANIRNAYRSMDSALIVADDFKNIQYSVESSSEYAKFDGLSRPGYEGGAGGSAKSKASSTGEWAPDVSDPSSPLMVIGTEILPTGAMRDIASTLERLFPVEVTRENAFRSGKAAEYDAAVRDPRNALHMAAFVRWVAGKLDEAETLDDWREDWLILEAEEKAGLLARGKFVTPRIAEVAAVPIVGIMVWTRYLLDIGAVTESERDVFVEKTRNAAAAVALRHAALLSGGGEPHQILLDTLRSGTIAGAIYVGDYDPEARIPRVGTFREVDGEMCVLLLPDQIVAYLHRDDRFRSLSRAQLSRDLGPVLKKQPGDESRGTRRLRLDSELSGGSANGIPVYCIPVAEWGITS